MTEEKTNISTSSHMSDICKTWITKEGVEIPYEKIDDSHLMNIIRFVKKMAKERDGEIIAGGGFTSEDIWYEIGYTEDWLEKFDYDGLLEEASKRGLALRTQKKGGDNNG